MLNSDMKECVDLYAKLLIGTFSFIGPSFTLFISLFYGQLKRLLSENFIRLETFIKTGETELINRETKKMVASKKSHSPQRQVKRVFGSLLLSIALIEFYYFQHSHFWPYNRDWIRITTICVSVSLFLYGVLVLWQMFCIIIQAKKSEEDEKEREQTQLQTKNHI